MDIYRALIGEPPTEEEKLAALAAQLRMRNNQGMLGQLSGDRVLAPMGKNLSETANEQAQQLGVRGESARYRKYQEGASSRMDDRARREQAWREADAIAQRQHELALEALRQRGSLAVAGVRAGSGDKKFNKMTTSQVNKLTDEVTQAKRLKNLTENFDDSYAGFAPFVRGAANKVSSFGLGSEKVNKAAEWWAEYNTLYNMKERNELFGATLTENEKKDWEKNAINTNMKPDQIRTRLAFYRQKYSEKLPMMRRNLELAGYDPELLDSIFVDPMERMGTEQDDIVELD